MTMTHEDTWTDGLADMPAAVTHARLDAALATDHLLAVKVRDGLRDLAVHHAPYASVFSRCPGVRLAAEFNAGYVAHATGEGRAAMQAAYVKIVAAQTLETGLDTNELVDRVTGRSNARIDHGTR